MGWALAAELYINLDFLIMKFSINKIIIIIISNGGNVGQADGRATLHQRVPMSSSAVGNTLTLHEASGGEKRILNKTSSTYIYIDRHELRSFDTG